MKVHGRFFWANLILGIILAVIAVADLIIGIALYTADKGMSHSEKSDMTWNIEEGFQEEIQGSQTYQWYTRMKVEKAEAELLGDTCEGSQAKAGYQFYKVNICVKNEGTMSASGVCVSTSFQGTHAADVIEYREEHKEFDTNLEYSSYEVIPAAQSGIVTRIIQVKKGITEINMTYFEDSGDSGICRVKLP